MSMELYVFLAKQDMPSREKWQAAITRLKIPLELDPTTNPLTVGGFCPMHLRGDPTGVEIAVGSAVEFSIDDFPNATEEIGGRDAHVSFCWGGSFEEGACAFGAAAGLIESFGAVAFSPEEESWLKNATSAIEIMNQLLSLSDKE